MKITKTTRLNIATEIQGANVTLNCEFEESPTQVNVNGWYNGNGVSSNLNRTYVKTATGVEFSPIPANVVYPYDAEFDAELLTIVEDLFENYATY